ncbi:MAG: ABC transporter permease [SAR324 cluster bacterium]|nr:ABC transporter permease [SAR324 cluster bacterium]
MHEWFNKDSIFWRLLSILIFFSAWEIAGRVPISPAFPTFIDTMEGLFRMISDGSFFEKYMITLKPLLVGVFITCFFGITFGVSMGLSDRIDWLGQPVFIVLQAAPVSALIPMITYVYGIGFTSKIIAVCILAMPVVVLNSINAVRNANTSLIEMSRSFQGTRMQEVFKVILPDASPMIFAGLRLGVAGGFVGIVLAELLITPTGIGDLISYHRSVANYAEMYATVLSIILLAAATVRFFERLEVRLFRPEKQGT